MTDQFSAVRHALGIAEEATANREAQDKEIIAEQAKYITQLERDTLELEKQQEKSARRIATLERVIDTLEDAIEKTTPAEREARK
jgi:predicted RNase H-like nuclease (RuvC/YqgF family)